MKPHFLWFVKKKEYKKRHEPQGIAERLRIYLEASRNILIRGFQVQTWEIPQIVLLFYSKDEKKVEQKHPSLFLVDRQTKAIKQRKHIGSSPTSEAIQYKLDDPKKIERRRNPVSFLFSAKKYDKNP